MIVNPFPRRVRTGAIAPALCLAAAVVLSLAAKPIPQNPARPDYLLKPAAIYSSNPQDSWNRIFAILFSRQFQVYITSDFPEAAPFDNSASGGELRVSTRLFDRIETGDRAIDPLYYPPYNSREGRTQLLEDSTYSEFMAAMQEALADNSPRPALARAWMQSDLWSAYDILSEPLFKEDRSVELEMRHAAALDALARLIRKVALTPEEIQSLPDNYAQAKSALALPDLFDRNSGWLQVQWFREHAHYDDEHPKIAMDIVKRYATTDRMQTKVMLAAKRSIQLLDNALTTGFKAYSVTDQTAVPQNNLRAVDVTRSDRRLRESRRRFRFIEIDLAVALIGRDDEIEAIRELDRTTQIVERCNRAGRIAG